MKPMVLGAIFLGVLSAPLPVLAHSFQLGLVLPSAKGGADRQALDGLLLATRERDGHPDETSDGHLGGLDSHVTPIDSGTAADPAQLRALAEGAGLDIVTAAVASEELDRIGAALSGQPAVFCPPDAGPVPAQRPDSPEAAVFAAAFQVEFGYPPTKAAVRGYNAGRAVDAVVRALGEVSDKAALARLCTGTE